MVEISACISSGHWQPGFRVVQLFHVHTLHSSDRTPSYGSGIDYVYVFSQSGRRVDRVRKLALNVHSARQGTGAMLEALQQ